MEFDFSGFATKAGLECSDGKTIKHGAFKHNSGATVPLVWQHLHNDPGNVLGHAVLEDRDGDTYAYCKFNETDKAKIASQLVEHGDVVSLSIYANQLTMRGQDVYHGNIREVSLVLAGANPGALIDNVSIKHGDLTEVLDDEALIYMDLPLEHADTSNTAGGSGTTVEDVLNTMNEEQKNVVYFLLGQAQEAATGVTHSDEGTPDPEATDEESDDALTHSDKEGSVMHTNIFEQGTVVEKRPTLSHDQLNAIFSDAGPSLKQSFLAHAGTYGIDNIDLLFPDAQTVRNSPDFISRRMEWVSEVLGGSSHSPFSRIKSRAADITPDAARAKGYVTGAQKKEEVFALLGRVTTPTTVYKKQKLDRDDIIDITDLDVVAFLKEEMRIMLDEELARAALIGDGRDVADPDKIKDPGKLDGAGIRSIWTDDDMYAHHVLLPAATTDIGDKIEAIIRARKNYKGSGNPVFFTTSDFATDMLLSKDLNGQRIYKSMADVASDLRVSKIVEVEVMEGKTRDLGASGIANLVGIIVNMKDYTFGADKGGAVSMFDDFDIDFNQYKYLIETRTTGTLTLPKSALVIEQDAA